MCSGAPRGSHPTRCGRKSRRLCCHKQMFLGGGSATTEPMHKYQFKEGTYGKHRELRSFCQLNVRRCLLGLWRLLAARRHHPLNPHVCRQVPVMLQIVHVVREHNQPRCVRPEQFDHPPATMFSGGLVLKDKTLAFLFQQCQSCAQTPEKTVPNEPKEKHDLLLFS